MDPTFVPDVLPFSRRDSLLTLRWDSGALVLSRFIKEFNPDTKAAREYKPEAFRFVPDPSGTVSCSADPSVLTLAGDAGETRLCFDGADTVRLRSAGLFPDVVLPPGKPEETGTFLDPLDGTALLNTTAQGAFLFVPLRGMIRVLPNRLQLSPDPEGIFELAVHASRCEPLRRQHYRSFDACADESLGSFEAWTALYGDLPARFSALGRLCAYAVWICCVTLPDAPQGYVTLYYRYDSAYCWQSAYHAMGTVRDPDTAADLLLTMFQYQDPFGQLPDLVDDRYVHYLSTKPPLQGFVFLNLLPRLHRPFTRDHLTRLYDPFRHWYTWWMACRDSDRDGVPQYNQGCECSMDTSAMFARGVPVECPDLLAYLILLAEALETMADALDRPREQALWHRERDRLLEILLRDFWNGERFFARVSGSHVPVETREIEMYTPILLGRRLPSDIRRRLVQDLLDPKQYWTPIGLRHAPPGSGEMMQGVVGGFWQIKFAVGLRDAGEPWAAAELLRRYCEINLRLGPSLGYHEKEADLQALRPSPRLGLYSALACGIFLASAELLAESEAEIQAGGGSESD